MGGGITRRNSLPEITKVTKPEQKDESRLSANLVKRSKEQPDVMPSDVSRRQGFRTGVNPEQVFPINESGNFIVLNKESVMDSFLKFSEGKEITPKLLDKFVKLANDKKMILPNEALREIETTFLGDIQSLRMDKDGLDTKMEVNSFINDIVKKLAKGDIITDDIDLMIGLLPENDEISQDAANVLARWFENSGDTIKDAFRSLQGFFEIMDMFQDDPQKLIEMGQNKIDKLKTEDHSRSFIKFAEKLINSKVEDLKNNPKPDQILDETLDGLGKISLGQDVQSEKKSPFSQDRGTVPQDTVKFQEPFPPDGWINKMRNYAVNGTDKFIRFKAKHDSAVVDNIVTGLNLVINSQEDSDIKNILMKNFLHQELSNAYTPREGGQGLHPEQGKIQKAIVVLEVLIAKGGGFDTPDKAENIMRSISMLSNEQQVNLMKADQLTGNRLMNALFTVSTTNDVNVSQDQKNSLKELYKEMKSNSQLAKVSLTMDKGDPTGSVSKLINDFVNVLDEKGVSRDMQIDFIEKFAFKVSISGQYKYFSDFEVPNPQQNEYSQTSPNSNAQFRENVTSRLISTFAELSSVDDKTLKKVLDLPPKDLTMQLAKSFVRNREGDYRIIQLIKNEVNNLVSQGKDELQDVAKLIDGLETGNFNVKSFLEKVENDTPLNQIINELEQESEQALTNLANEMVDRLQELKNEKGVLQQELQTKLDTINNKVDELQEINDSIIQLQDEHPDLGNSRDPELADLKKTLFELIDSSESLSKSINSSRNDYNKLKDTYDQRIVELDKFTNKFEDNQNFTVENIKKVMKLFGANSPSFKGLGSLLKWDEKNLGASYIRQYTELFSQLDTQIQMRNNPEMYKTELNKMVMTLPTAGKELKQCPWLQSTTDDLVRMAKVIRESDPNFTLENNPIIILNQSDARNPQLHEQNKLYCQSVENKYSDLGLKIVHVSMEEIEGLIRDSGIEKLFDTTGERFAGYGGARNMAFMLAPVIQDTIKNGGQISDITPEQIKGLIQSKSMDTQPWVFMGDDTDYVSSGTLFSKTAFSNLHDGEYCLSFTQRDGRDTMNVGTSQTNNLSELKNGLDSFSQVTHKSNSWNMNLKRPGMGSVFCSPRFCLDLPIGAEEKQHEAIGQFTDYFGKASHLSGDRMKGLSEHVKGHLAYTNTSDFATSIVNNNDVLLWNKANEEYKAEHGVNKFNSLREVLEYASDPDIQKESQTNFFKGLADWSQKTNSGILGLDRDYETFFNEVSEGKDLTSEDLAEVNKLKEVYLGAKKASQDCKLFADTLLKNLSGLDNLDNMDNVKQAISDNMNLDNFNPLQIIRDTKAQLENDNNINFNSHPVLKNLFLTVESLGGGQFSELARNLLQPPNNN